MPAQGDRSLLHYLALLLAVGSIAYTTFVSQRSSSELGKMHLMVTSDNPEGMAAEINRLSAIVDELQSQQVPVGPSGARGPRGYAGEPGPPGYCVRWDGTPGTESEFACPQAADSEVVQQNTLFMQSVLRNLIDMRMQREQALRASGQSGLVQTRAYTGGSAAYHEPSYSNYGIANVHDHADNKRTVGMGEIAAVLNGVEFWTRHNDYLLVSPHTTNTDYGAAEELDFPDVPPSVLAKPTVAEQVTEMQEYFKAFQTQNSTHRDFAPYFPSVLCYLEGAWITDLDALNEPFASDRHQIDADTWEELHEIMNFLTASGRKNNLENIAFLPSGILDMVGPNRSQPLLANFEYTIKCHNLEESVPHNRFRPARDMHQQLWGWPLTLEELAATRRARFEVNQEDSDTWFVGQHGRGLLDTWMEQIPGKDNYPGDLRDDAYATRALEPETGNELNAAYYSRYYSIPDNDAMGRDSQRRTFGDGALFLAMTSQEKVAAMSMEYEGVRTTQRWSYAIPLELIYLTPLTNWNPYSIPYYGDNGGDPDYQGVRANGRFGSTTDPNLAFDGSNVNTFYRTPKEFFGQTGASDPADTASNIAGVLDVTDTLRECSPSGHWILFPEIPGVGVVRQRYPIMPIHEHGGSPWKELKALQDVLLGGGGGLDKVKSSTLGVNFELTFGQGHVHYAHVSGDDYEALRDGNIVYVRSTTANGHDHNCGISWDGQNYILESITGPVDGHQLVESNF